MSGQGSIALPPSPNWYQTSVSDATFYNGGLLAYGAKNSVVVVRVCAEDANGKMSLGSAADVRFIGSLAGHTDRVASVSFCKHRAVPNLLVTGSNDKAIRLWDVQAMLPLGILGKHDAAVTAIACVVCCNESLVLSVSRDYSLRVWDLQAKDLRTTWSPLPPTGGSMWPCAVAPSPSCPHVAALGYHSGLVVLVNFTRSEVLCKLAGHEEEIQSMAWSPVAAPAGAGEDISGMLSTSSKDKTIRLWEVSHGCVSDLKGSADCISTLTVPKPAGALTPQQKTRLWVACTWVCLDGSAPSLVTTGYTGDLVIWSLEKKPTSRWRPQKLGAGHSRPVFSVLALRTDMQSLKTDVLLTVSMDRLVGAWNLSTMKSQWMIPSLGGFIYELAFSPSNPGRLALAVGDKSIRVWRMGPLSSKPFDVLFLWKGVRDKVTALCFHPQAEDILAFGLMDGAVGVYQISGSDEGQSYRMLSGQHDGAVTTLQWPDSKDASSVSKAGGVDIRSIDSTLYTCGGDGKMLQWGLKDTSECRKPVDVALALGQIDFYCSCISFSNQRAALAHKDGSIHVYQIDAAHDPDIRTWKVLRIFHEHIGPVTALSWQRGQANENNLLLASASEDCSIRIWDTEAAAGSEQTMEQSADGPASSSGSSMAQQHVQSFGPSSHGECLAVLEGHGRPATSLSWSPHRTRRCLVSGSLDGTAQVWQIAGKTAEESLAVSNMRGHQGRVLCVVWSETEPGILYTGSDDQSVRRWNATEPGPYRQPPVRKRKQNKLKSDTGDGHASKDDPPSRQSEKQAVGTKSPPTPLRKRGRPKKMAVSFLGNADQSADQVQPATARECVELAESLRNGDCTPASGDGNDLFLGVAGAVRLVDRYCATMESRTDKAEPRAVLEMWKGNIGAALNLMMTASNTGTIFSDRTNLGAWVALSPLAGRDAWQMMMQTHASELLLSGNVHYAALLFLACGHNKKAVESYQACGLYEEAILIARLRLGDDTDEATHTCSDLVCKIYLDFAAEMTKLNHLELAAKSLIAAGQPHKAVHILSRLGTLDAYESAYKISCLSSTGEVAVASLCGCKCQEMGLWEQAAAYFAKHGELDALSCVLSTEKMLVDGVEQAEIGACGGSSQLVDRVISACESAGIDLGQESAVVRLRLAIAEGFKDTTRHRPQRLVVGLSARALCEYALDLHAQRLSAKVPHSPRWPLLLTAVESLRNVPPEDSEISARIHRVIRHESVFQSVDLPSVEWMLHKSATAGFCEAWVVEVLLGCSDFTSFTRFCEEVDLLSAEGDTVAGSCVSSIAASWVEKISAALLVADHALITRANDMLDDDAEAEITTAEPAAKQAAGTSTPESGLPMPGGTGQSALAELRLRLSRLPCQLGGGGDLGALNSSDWSSDWSPPPCPNPIESAVELLKLLKHAAALGMPGATATCFDRIRSWAVEHSWAESQREQLDSHHF